MEAESRLVIDTNVLIVLGTPQAVRFLQNTAPGAFLSTITTVELLIGTGSRNTRRREVLIELVDEHEIVPVSRAIAIIAGDIAREHQLTIPDAIIAATALSLNAILVTRDRKAHTRVPGLRVLIPY